jgi:hypothetical protein
VSGVRDLELVHRQVDADDITAALGQQREVLAGAAAKVQAPTRLTPEQTAERVAASSSAPEFRSYQSAIPS